MYKGFTVGIPLYILGCYLQLEGFVWGAIPLWNVAVSDVLFSAETDQVMSWGKWLRAKNVGIYLALQVRMQIGKSHKNRMTWQYQLTASQQWKLPVGVLHWTYCKSNVHHISLPRKERVVASQLQLQWIGLVKHRVPLNSLLLITIPIENAMWQRRISAFQAHPNIRLSVICIYIYISHHISATFTSTIWLFNSSPWKITIFNR